MKILVRVFEGTRNGKQHFLSLTAGQDTYPEALQAMEEMGISALQHKFPGITDVTPVGTCWTEQEIEDLEEEEEGS